MKRIQEHKLKFESDIVELLRHYGKKVDLDKDLQLHVGIDTVEIDNGERYKLDLSPEKALKFANKTIDLLKKHKLLREDIQNFIMSIDIQIGTGIFPEIYIRMGLPD